MVFNTFKDIPEVECFIDDIGIFTNNSLDHYLTIVHQVLLRLEESDFTANPLKCACAVQSTDSLRVLLTTDSIKAFTK